MDSCCEFDMNLIQFDGDPEHEPQYATVIHPIAGESDTYSYIFIEVGFGYDLGRKNGKTVSNLNDTALLQPKRF